MSRSRTLIRVALLLILALVAFAARQAPAVSAAPPTDLFISEYLESQPGNRKAIEIYNGTGSAITLTGVYNVAVYANGATSPTSIALSGSIPAGGVFVLGHTDTAAAYPSVTFNQTSGSLTFNGNDAVALRNGTTLVDVLGQIGNNPGTEWGTGLTSTADNTIRRKATICAGDTNGSDAFDPATEYDGYADGTSSGLGSHTASCGGGGDTAPTVTSTTPANSAPNVALAADISVTFSEAVTVSGAWYTISCANSGTHTATVSGGPTTFTLNPDTNFTGGELCTVTIESTLVADQDGTADNMTADYTFSFTTTTPSSVCGDPATPIHDIQGNGTASPDDGVIRTIEGIVVGDFQDYTTDPPNELSGYFLQEEDAQVDADPNTSEGIFVFDGQNPATNAALGDKVRVTGTVDEFNTLTELTSVSNTQVCSSGNTLPTAASITLPVTALTDYEKFEGMRVTFPQELTVTDTFTLGRFGEILLSEGGRLPSPTDAAEPGAPAQAVRAANILRSIFLDDGLTNQNPDPLIHPAPGLSASNTLRGGDTTTGLTGTLYYLSATGEYRIMPSEAITWNHENPRPTDAPVISGTLQIVGSNTLNYFITLDNPNTTADNICGPANNQECRGANTSQEFTRQRDKFLKALAEMDADVFGLMELENNSAANPAGDANDPVLEDIVNGLNALVGAGTYDFIDTGTLGGDAIKVGLIYKPATVTPVGDYAVLDSSVDPLFDTTRNRPALAQTFEEIATGGQLTVVVNHFKSKGSCPSSGPNTEQGDLQGCWNPVRTDAATALVNWLATDPTDSGDPDFLVIGDLNSYAKEDPIDVFINAGYVDLADAYNTDPYSYTFDGEWGYLDYALANPSLATQVTDAKEWHVNADEPIVLDYNTEFKTLGQISSFYSNDPFRWSDHDPIIVGFDLDVPDTTAPTVTIDQASGQADPTSTSPIHFTVVFSEAVSGFATGDVTLIGTAGATTAVVTQIAPNDGTTYDVAVSGMTTNGTVIATISAGVAQDAASNFNVASTSTDNTVTYNVPAAAASIYVSTTAAGSVGAVSFGSEDILHWDGSAWSVWFDGSAAGLQGSTNNINAFYIPETGNNANSDTVLMSFIQNARPVPGVGRVDGMDLVTWNGSAFSLTFDGQDVGLTILTAEKIDGLHELDPSLAPAAVRAAAGGTCLRYFLISTAGNGKVTNYDGKQLKISGEDVLGFCATQLGANTAGKWHMLLDGSAQGVKPNNITGIAASADGQTLYLTSNKAFNVDGAVGGHSMVYMYNMVTTTFSGPIFSAPATGLGQKVDGLHMVDYPIN